MSPPRRQMSSSPRFFVSAAPALAWAALAWLWSAEGAAPQPPAGYTFISCGSPPDVSTSNPSLFTAAAFSAPNVTYTITPSGTPKVNKSPLSADEGESTLRVWDPPGGCYSITAQPANYSVRLGFAYFNYDGLLKYPSMIVQLKDVIVDNIYLREWEQPTVRALNSAPTGTVSTAHYTEYVSDFPSGNVTVCVWSADNATSPILNSIELVPYSNVVLPEVETLLTQNGIVLSLKKRINLGGGNVGPAPSEDPLMRRWMGSDNTTLAYFATNVPRYTNVTSSANITVVPSVSGVAAPPLPQSLFQTAVQEGSIPDPQANLVGIEMDFWPVDPTHLLVVRMFFAELNQSVSAGQRQFNISLGDPFPLDPNVVPAGPWVPTQFSSFFDIYTEAGNKSNTGFYLTQAGCYLYPVQGSMSRVFLFLLGAPAALPPIINAVELYEVVPSNDSFTPCVANGNNNTNTGTPQHIQTTPAEGPKGISGAAIAGLVLASVAVAAALAVLVAFIVRGLSTGQQLNRFHAFEQDRTVP